MVASCTSEYFFKYCYVLQMCMEQTSSVLVVVLCVLVLPFILGNYVAVVRWFLCPGCLASCKSQVLLLQQQDMHGIECLVFHDGPIVCVFVIVWVSVVPMGTLYCPSVTGAGFFPEIWLVRCLLAVPWNDFRLFTRNRPLRNYKKLLSLQQSVQKLCSMHCYDKVDSQGFEYDVWTTKMRTNSILCAKASQTYSGLCKRHVTIYLLEHHIRFLGICSLF